MHCRWLIVCWRSKRTRWHQALINGRVQSGQTSLTCDERTGNPISGRKRTNAWISGSLRTLYKPCKHIHEVKKLPYEERLRRIKLPSLEFRRFRGDLIETYKIAHNLYDKNSVNSLLNFRSKSRLRGHQFTIIKNSTKKYSYQHFFTNRVCNAWNSLPEDIANAKSLNSFKNKIDKKYKDLMFITNLPLNSTLFS